MTYDERDRVVTRTFPDGGVEGFLFSTNGLVASTNQLMNSTFYTNDVAGRKIAELNANGELAQFAYDPASNLLRLTDGRTNVTTWNYDQYGRGTNKVDAASNIIFVYKFDANDRLTNRWTPAKTNAVYSYDAGGNLTKISYAVNVAVSMTYDALDRITNMVDGVGTTAYSYTLGGFLQTEDGPWASDTVTYTYQNRLRSGLNLQAPNASDWVQSYGYDGGRRLTTLTSPAGAFGYAYDPIRQMQVSKLILPNGAYITNAYDNEARMLSTVLKNSGNTTLNSHSYGYNAANQRTALTNLLGDYRSYGYDKIGQLKTAIGKEPGGTTNRLNEQFGYAYDSAGNLNYRTNNDLFQTFNVNSLNELSALTRNTIMTVEGTTTSPATNVTVNSVVAIRYADNTFARTNVSLIDGLNTFTANATDTNGRTSSYTSSATLPASTTLIYDLNGNLRTNSRAVTLRIYDYDDENQLIRVMEPNSWKSEFTYDGKMRRRIRKEYIWQSGIWNLQSEIRYIYDGNLVIQERDANNLPVNGYTRGRDLSGTMQGAGGIGGLVSFSQMTTLSPQHFYYHADGNGNVSMVVNSFETSVAKYLYDPFGGTLSSSGPLADSNLYRFSSKEAHLNSGLIYYLYRFYDPALIRWLNRDPIGEEGGVNLYGFVGNDPANTIDPLGQDFIAVGGLPVPTMPVLGIGVHMSLRYYKASCSDNPKEGVRFSPGSPPKGSQFEDAVQLWTAWHTYRHFFYVRPKPTEPPQRTFVFVPISYIERASAATRLLVLYSDADNGRGSSEKGWKQIIAAAATYAYAEQADASGNVPTTLTHWPNSWYQLLGNNSNTFIRQMGKLIGRDPDAIGGGWIAGRRDPEPVSNPGWTPVYSPW